MGWEIMSHPPYSPALDSIDFNFFDPMKLHLSAPKRMKISN
jgi:hypothetical protein